VVKLFNDNGNKVHFVQALLIGLFLLMSTSQIHAQEFKDNEGETHLGLQMGLNVTTLFGTELEFGQAKRGTVLGLHYRRILTKNFQLRAELNASLRGSTFGFTSEERYSAIKLTYLDLPIAAMFNVSGSEANKHIVVGLEPSFLLQSEVYVNPDLKARVQNQGFKKNDLAIFIGYHIDKYYLGFEPSIRFGLLNINDGLNLPNILPPTGKNGTIQNIAVDFRIYF
jgi:hypothetical protein